MARTTSLAPSLMILQQPHQSYCTPEAGPLHGVLQHDDIRPTQARGGGNEDADSLHQLHVRVFNATLASFACVVVYHLNLEAFHQT